MPGATLAAVPAQQHSPLKISRAADGSVANGASGWPSLSADGSAIAFASQAENLLPGDLNAASDVFRYNSNDRTVELLSLSSQGAQANAASYSPAMAANGRLVAFTSLATNLDAADTNGLPDIYLRNLDSGATLRVSRPPDGSPANGWSDQAQLSADGRFVLFISTATNLASDSSRSVRRVFLYDTRDGLLHAISSPSSDASLAAISADGRYTVLLSAVGRSFSLSLYDRLDGSTRPLDLDIQDPRWQQLVSQLAISADGSRLALLVNSSPSAAIFLYHRQADELVKVASLEPSARSRQPPGSRLPCRLTVALCSTQREIASSATI